MPEMELTPSDRLAPFWPLIPGIRWGTLTVGLVITAIRQVYELDVFLWGLVLLGYALWRTFGPQPVAAAAVGGGDWPTARGGLQRRGAVPGDAAPTRGGVNWSYDSGESFFSSPALPRLLDPAAATTCHGVERCHPRGRNISSPGAGGNARRCYCDRRRDHREDGRRRHKTMSEHASLLLLKWVSACVGAFGDHPRGRPEQRQRFVSSC